MKVEAKDIPIIQKFLTEYWKAIKEFYSVEVTDEYSKQACDRLEELGELAGICPDKHDKQFILDCVTAFCRLLHSKQKEMRERTNEQNERV